MEEIIIWEDVLDKLDKLTKVLYENEYFGFNDSCEAYVEKVYDFIQTTPKRVHHKTCNPRHGKYYAVYEVKNKRTRYYITFDKKGDRYLVKNIISSHEAHYPIYIRNTTI